MKIIFTVAILIASQAFADVKTDQTKLDAARVLLSSKDLSENKKGFSMLKSLAESGLPDAALGMGLMFYKGTGVLKDQMAAYNWYEKAAKDGNSRALYLLSVRYRRGCDGAKKDVSKGEELLKKALANANEQEKNEIGVLEKHQLFENVCSSESKEDMADSIQKKPIFLMHPYKNFVFSGWDLKNRLNCPKEHSEEKSKFTVYVDPKKYEIENWCQCYLANIKQDSNDDLKLLDQKIDFYIDACLKESSRK